MRKIFILLISFVMGVPCFSWGLLDEFAYTPNTTGRANYVQENAATYKQTILYSMLHDHKSNFIACLTATNGVGIESIWGIFVRTFPTWVSTSRRVIMQSGRAEEFADFLSWIPQKLSVERVSCRERRDIEINADTHGMHTAGRADWASEEHLWKINLALGRVEDNAGLHEVGHLFGLSDLSSKGKNHSPFYSLYAVGEVPTPGTSVMWWQLDAPGVAEQLTCDDVEGFINAVDYVQFREGKKSPRLEKGWKSICGKPYIYLRGRVARNEEELAKIKQETDQLRLRGGTISQLQTIRNQWLSYLDNKVKPLKEKKEEELKKLPRPLDNEGLVLSAEVHYLRDLEDCVFDTVTDVINKAGDNTQMHAISNLNSLKQQLADTWCSPNVSPLAHARLLTTIPLEQDYATGRVHKCAVCGHDIVPGTEERRTPTYKDPKTGKELSKTYYKHKTCEALTSKRALLSYQDNPAGMKQTAPTYQELKQRMAGQNISASVRQALSSR